MLNSKKKKAKKKSSKPNKGIREWSTAKKLIWKYRKQIRGTMVCVDPSSGSSSSQPGYAIYREGELIGSGEMKIGVAGELWKRLKKLGEQLIEIENGEEIDILVTEKIPPTARSFVKGKKSFFRRGHDSLLKSVGSIISCSSSEVVIELPIRVWKDNLPEGYEEKGDEWDAIAFGHACLKVLEQLEEEKK